MKWSHYGAVVEPEGYWCGATLGEMPDDQVVPEALDLPLGNLPLLGTWDHQPSTEELDALTPWNYRTICPACGVENCNDIGHNDKNWKGPR